MFEIGQMVVCIRDDWNLIGVAPGTVFPQRNQVLTVRSVDAPVDPGAILDEYLRFDEIINALTQGATMFGECNFAGRCFRPVRPTSIKWAREIVEAVKRKTPIENEVRLLYADETRWPDWRAAYRHLFGHRPR